MIESDNRELVDAGNVNQQLTTDDIERMKEEGRSGLDIIEALKEKSVTFATKTKFSQVLFQSLCCSNAVCLTCKTCKVPLYCNLSCCSLPLAS